MASFNSRSHAVFCVICEMPVTLRYLNSHMLTAHGSEYCRNKCNFCVSFTYDSHLVGEQHKLDCCKDKCYVAKEIVTPFDREIWGVLERKNKKEKFSSKSIQRDIDDMEMATLISIAVSLAGKIGARSAEYNSFCGSVIFAFHYSTVTSQVATMHRDHLVENIRKMKKIANDLCNCCFHARMTLLKSNGAQFIK